MYIKNDCTEIPYNFPLSHPVPNIHVVGIYLGWDLVLHWLGVLAGGSVPSGNKKESLQCCYLSQGHALIEN